MKGCSRRLHDLAIFAVTLYVLGLGKVEAAFSDTEDIFLSALSPSSARENLRYITSRPHVAGTKGDFMMASYVQEQFVNAGIPRVDIFELDAFLNYPKKPAQVQLVEANSSKVLFRASLSEEILAFDDTSDTFWRNHTFHGYGASGKVSAPMVYANFGRPQDFEALENAGVDVAGSIVLIRYGKCFRGLKVRNAQERGAVGVLIYSDPQEDGYVQGPTYPDGPWRSESSVQRGSVQFISKCAGDPMRADSRYKTRVEDLCGVKSFREMIPEILSLPISYGDALPLLKRMGGVGAVDIFEDFVGGLDVEYTVGPSSDLLLLEVENTEVVTGIPNVVAVIDGELPEEEDMPILLGNHRDAW